MKCETLIAGQSGLSRRESPSRQLPALREAKGPFTCLASDPAQKAFHVACYHKSMEPFMARGRALRASGVTGDAVDSARFAEVRAGQLVMPKQPAAMYQLFGGPDAFDAASGTAKAQALGIPPCEVCGL